MMTSFRFKALQPDGKAISGRLDGENAEAVVQQIRSKGLLPISVSTASPPHLGEWLSWGRSRQRGGGQVLAIATHELATLLEAGLPLDRALTTLVNLDEVKPLRVAFTAVRDRVRSGASLADAMTPEAVFPKLYVSMVRAGELGGALDKTLPKLGDYLLRAQAVRDAVISALIYPGMLTLTGLLSISVILLFVIPQFEPLFRDSGKEMPAMLSFVLLMSTLLEGIWWGIILAGIAVVFTFRRKLAQPDFRLRFDVLLLKVPILGKILKAMEMERFSRSLGTLLASGVDLHAALRITRDTLANRSISAVVGAAAVSLREGEGLADKLAKSGVFPELTIDLIRVGEETGTLEQMLQRHADLCERGLKHSIDRLLALLVPSLTIVFGIMVAGLVGSMIFAILSVNDLAA